MKYLGSELSKFSHQISYAIEHYHSPAIDKTKIKNIVLCGMGGSGIAGQIVRDYFLDKLALPVAVNADYTLPLYVSSESLVICSSYSGETEETLNAFHLAKEKGAQIICIAKGGMLAQSAKDNGYTCYAADGGFQPRVALGYSLTYLILVFCELLGQSKGAELKQVADKMSFTEDFIKESAMLAKQFKSDTDKKFLIFADTAYQGLAIRLANQIQENAKAEAFTLILPEANHNQIETHYGALPTNYVFLNSGISKRTNLRFHFLEELLKKENAEIVRIPQADRTLAGLYRTIYLCDWLSLQLADQRNAVSNTVPNIMDLKTFLGKN